MKRKNFVRLIVIGVLIVLSVLLAVPKLIAHAEKADELARGGGISVSITMVEAPRSLQIREAMPDSLDRYLDRLEDFECTGCGSRYKRLDSNSQHSYACLQFQRATWEEMVRRFGTHDEQEKAKDPDSIFDCDFQKSIARRMFEYNPKWAAQHWYTSIYTRGLGLPEIN